MLASLSESQAEEKAVSNTDQVIQTYGDKNLGSRSIFQGGFINFGYWEGISTELPISLQDRIRASVALYDQIIDRLNIQAEDEVLEIGFGLGHGCVRVLEKYHPKIITGMDITPQQVERAKTEHAKELRANKALSFHLGSAEKTGFSDSSFTKIFSVEAAQCFPSMRLFAREMRRILKPGGQLTIAAHFATSESAYEKVAELIPTVKEGIDLLIPISLVRQAFEAEGFIEKEFTSIGSHVFLGFDQWITQVALDVWWGHNCWRAYHAGFLDYYILSCKLI